MDETIEIPVKGMDCTECTQHVQHAIAGLPGVQSVEVFLASEKAVVRLDPVQVSLPAIRKAVAEAGYTVPDAEAQGEVLAASFTRQALSLFGIVFGIVLFIVVIGEWLGLFEKITEMVPWPVGLVFVLAAGYPVFRNVIQAALKKQVISHTLMTFGVIAALAVGEWATAVVVVFFMRVGDYAEKLTTERARRAIQNLTGLAPQMARVERQGLEQEIPAQEVQPGETVIVRPGEKIPVDGEVTGGQATIDQSAITGESMPIEAGAGSKVYAASIIRLGSLRLRTTHSGPDTTFGRVIKLVEEAETHRASVQRVADKFSAYYLPVVSAIAVLTILLRRDPLAAAAVLVVACSCSFALATPIAMLASIGAAARRGLLIKGGKYLESLDQADVLLIDKTGTVTLGKPQITDNSDPSSELLLLAASAERYSEHPLAEAVRAAAVKQGLQLLEPEAVEMIPGLGVKASLDGRKIAVGSRRLLEKTAYEVENEKDHLAARAAKLEAEGKTVLWIAQDGDPIGFLAAADTLRPEVTASLAALYHLGIQQIELLTGDNPLTAASLVDEINRGLPSKKISFRAQLLPEDKIAIVKEYQAQGHRVVMVGDGVNDAPALAQADVGIAMGAAGTDIAIDAAHIALMRDDWSLVPQALEIAHRTLRVVKLNIAFTTVYNLVGLSLAAMGILPPILAAAAQSLPDLGILANSSRLLRQK